MNPRKILAISEAKLPSNKPELRSFLGMTGVYRRFVKNYSKRASPLTKLTRKDSPETFELTEEQRIAAEDLRTAITSAPALSLPLTVL